MKLRIYFYWTLSPASLLSLLKVPICSLKLQLSCIQLRLLWSSCKQDTVHLWYSEVFFVLAEPREAVEAYNYHEQLF